MLRTVMSWLLKVSVSGGTPEAGLSPSFSALSSTAMGHSTRAIGAAGRPAQTTAPHEQVRQLGPEGLSHHSHHCMHKPP